MTDVLPTSAQKKHADRCSETEKVDVAILGQKRLKESNVKLMKIIWNKI